MASSSRIIVTPTIRYDVFLSFRGEDTRHSFTDHLYHALTEAGIRTFRDNNEIDRGQQLKPEIETAIIESRASIVVLSKNYANSRWCLDELCLILEQKIECGCFVLPVFYHVDPSDVRNQRRSFAVDKSMSINISKCFCTGANEGLKWTEVNVRRWKEALGEIGNLTGMELSGSMSETNFIAEVVEKIQRKLDLKQVSIPGFLVGMEAQVEVINSWLKDEQYNAIAICGMGGGGKTTLAQYFYNINKKDFQSSSFVEVSGKQPYGLLGLQKQLLKDVLGGKEVKISGVSEGTHKIEEVLQTKRVLIVLDDIDKHEQLSALLGTKVFPTQCKIIITTRFLGIHEWFGSISWKCQVHNLNLLNDHESLELLCWHAFHSKTPMEGFKDLAVQLARYCGGNPLALKVLGSSLVVSNEQSLRRKEMKKIWKSRMKSLFSMKGNLDRNIQDVLQKSFDSLPLLSDKELFLHIACFFAGEFKSHVEMILEGEFNAIFGISTLSQRCLLTVSADGKLMMHQLLQEMGRRIVCEESKDPSKRSRVWRDVESYNVLRKEEGSDTIEGLALDMRKVEHMMASETLALETSSLANMDKLKLLQLKYVKLSGSYENFPELLWLYWHGCPLQIMPPGLLTSSLVAIDLSHGHLEKFEAPMLFRLAKLQSLFLENCSNLTHLCSTIRDLENLHFLDLGGCTKLWKYVNQIIPNHQKSYYLPRSLIKLNLTNSNIEFKSDVCVAFHAQSSINLNMSANPFEYLPNNLDLNKLRILNVRSCTNLKSLPCIPSTLVELCIDWCTSLERVKFNSGRFSLQEFSYECCFKLFEIQGLFRLVPVAKVSKAGLGHMHWIKAYEDHYVDLVGNEITKGRIWQTQILYEYGIMSTYLQSIKDQVLTTYEHMSSSCFLSFQVPWHTKKHMIQGLNVSCLYRSLVTEDKDRWLLFVKISNRTKGLTWVYNPMVYCKPSVDDDVVWLSYWPIGNILDPGDELQVAIIGDGSLMTVSACGASIVYKDEQEVEDKHENISMKEEEVIGGDLSEFEVTKNGYYLCRSDFFGPNTSSWLKWLFGINVHYTDSQGWRKTHQSMRSWVQRYSLNSFLKRIELKVREGPLSSLVGVGVEPVSAHRSRNT